MSAMHATPPSKASGVRSDSPTSALDFDEAPKSFAAAPAASTSSSAAAAASEYISTVSIEGNIGVGKSTLMAALETALGDELSIADEPVEDWKEAGLLQAMYEGTLPGPLFQMMVLATRARAIDAARRGAILSGCKVLLTERSLSVGDRAFASVHFDPLPAIHGTCYQTAAKALSGLPPSRPERKLLVFIDAPASVCLERVRARCRDTEEKIELAYLEQLDRRHHELVAEAEKADEFKVVRVDGLQGPEAIARQVLAIVRRFDSRLGAGDDAEGGDAEDAAAAAGGDVPN